MHARFTPVPHRFSYPVYTFAFDLDEFPALDRRSRAFGYNRPALFPCTIAITCAGRDAAGAASAFPGERGDDDRRAWIVSTMPRISGTCSTP